MYRFQYNFVFVMYYIYVTSGPSLLIESTDSMIYMYIPAFQRNTVQKLHICILLTDSVC